MSTVPLLSSSSFKWMGFTGFSNLAELGLSPDANSKFYDNLYVKSSKTGTILDFALSHVVRSYTGEVVSYVYEALGTCDAEEAITLIIFQRLR